MSTITTIAAADQITASRTVINTNFSNLNTDKIETSVLDVDTTLAANSDLKVATQKAVKAYVDAGGNVNASTTTRGIVEEATQAEISAGTAAGATGARLFINPSTQPRDTVCVPLPVAPWTSLGANLNLDVNTRATVTLFSIERPITVNKISFFTGAVTTASTLDLTLYSEDGQTQHFSVTTASIASSGITYTTSVSSVVLGAGNYYLMVNANAAVNLSLVAYATNVVPFANATTGTLSDISLKPVIQGTLTITAGTPPATITPTALTPTVTANSYGPALMFRLDN